MIAFAAESGTERQRKLSPAPNPDTERPVSEAAAHSISPPCRPLFGAMNTRREATMRRLDQFPLSISEADGYRAAQVIRILRLIKIVHGATSIPPLDVLARRFEVCKRTIRRDLQVLRLVGATVPDTEDGSMRRSSASLPPPHYHLELDEEPPLYRSRCDGRSGGAR